jgi:hypothetical protein
MPDARLTPEQLARFRADYHECGKTVMPLVAEVEAAWADVARLRALLLAACRAAPEAVVTDGDTTMALAHLARRLGEGD